MCCQGYQNNRLLRLPEVILLTGLSRSSICRMEQRGDFPSRVRLGARSVGWLRDDVQTWMETRPVVSR